MIESESTELELDMRVLDDKNLMSDQDKVAYYLIVYLNQRYPKQLFENINQIVNII